MSNPSFKRCDKGHFFPASKSVCPHCNNEPIFKDEQTVQVETPQDLGSDNEDKTAIIGSNISSGGFSKESAVDTTLEAFNNGHTSSSNSDKTIINRPSKKDGDASNEAVARRKIVGWLVSYTLNEFGVDFKLYEGKNAVGRSSSATIKLIQDSKVSSEHATILFRDNKFYLQDNMASNPTTINDNEVMPGQTVPLKDGDVILFGDNTFLFRSSILADV